MRRKVVLILVSIVLVAGLIGCPSKTLTPKQLSASFMATYNTEYAKYKTDVAKPNLTDQDRQLLRQKKAILMDAWPLIATFDLAVVEGKVPDPALQAQILELIGRLTQKGGK